MSIIHVTSLSLQDIALELSKNILEEQKSSPLRAPVIVVPSANMKLWLNLNLARIGGLSTNVRFLFLEKTLEEYYCRRAGMKYDPSQRPFPSQEANQKKVLSYLLRKREENEFEFLNVFLRSIPRAFSLSATLTSLLKDYELNRSAWIESWAKEKGISIPKISRRSSPFPQEGDYYRFEKRVYQDVFLDSKTPATLNQFLLSEAAKKPERNPETFRSVHLFCLSNLADTYLEILKSMSEKDGIAVHLYQFHTGSVRESDAAETSGPERWAVPQAHIVSRISGTTGYKLRKLESSHIYPPRLEALRNMLQGNPVRSPVSNASSSDVSVRFWNAPSPYREMEAVANDILYKMDENPRLTYLDFAVLVTDMRTYRGAVEWVLDGGILLQKETGSSDQKSGPTPIRKKIPYSLTDIKADEASLLYRGLTNLWDLCSGPFLKKEDLLRLLRNPLLHKKLQLDADSISESETLIEESGIRYEEPGRERDPFQISNGIRRIRLSSVLNGESAWENHKIPLVDRISDEHSAAIAIFWDAVVKARNAVLSAFSGKKSELNLEYLNILKNTLENLFEFGSEREQEAKLFRTWLQSMREWEGVEFRSESEGIELLRFITDQIFDQIPYRKGAYLTGGITISLLQPMRPIPFEHVYILGLGEGKFPGSPDRSRLNLRKDFKEEWDLSKKEIQESLLWETIHSARESLTLSYVGENLQEDKTFEPCSHLFEIMEFFGVKNALKIPLHPYSPRYEHTFQTMAQGLVSYDFSRVWVNEDRKNSNILKRFQDPETLTPVVADSHFSSVDIRELSQFITDPLDSYLKKRLGMYLEEEEIRKSDEELFDLDAIAETSILREIHNLMFPTLISGGGWDWNEDKIHSHLAPLLEKRKASAKFPQSVFAGLKEADLIGYLSRTGDILKNWNLILRGGKYHRFLSLGDTGLPDSVCKKLPELEVRLKDGRSLNVRGEWEHVVEKNGTYYWILSKTLEDKPENDYYAHKDYWKTMSFPFLSSVAFSAIHENFKIYSFKPRPSENSRSGNILTLEYEIPDPRVSLDYFERAVSDYVKEEPVFFPRKAFLKYYLSEIQGGGKSKTPERTAKYDDEAAWENYLKEELSSVKEELSSLLRIYPKTKELILKSRILWAKDFYKPFLDWRKKS
ncbi:exodeoxyribonuclease V subunit gamma [Leptospira ellisii]|uniref:Exodeoxyribonuclease V subunit gamma n=2 Tax=Leptospira ellisii TaxID=2023197 RepID=A0AAE4U024_9LEPT|nr:exodeoxyribonuclease V subunit gamma [Leptospira ellisii]MDV6236705.1 exodeoxyribonuclease V subunit gamma [Leptospira ellisii]